MTSRRTAFRARRAAVARLAGATAAYFAAPGTDTLAVFLRAGDRAVRDIARRPAADETAVSDLREAIPLHEEATALMAGSVELPGLLSELGMTLHGLAAKTADPAAYLRARQVFGQALEAGRELAPTQALDAALAWRRLARPELFARFLRAIAAVESLDHSLDRRRATHAQP
jgi:hypothetical protein